MKEREDRPRPRAYGWLGRMRGVRGESGQALVIGAIAMVALLGALALAIDAGMLRYQRRQLQIAADAAALAAELEVQACGGTANCPAMQSAAQNALVENGFSGSSLLVNCAARSGTRLEVTVNNPPCAVSSDPNSGRSTHVEVFVSKPVPMVFARVLGFTQVPILARAEAGPSRPKCVYALDPSASGSLTVDSGAAVTADCGIVVESGSSGALQCSGGSLSASSILLVGGSSGQCAASPAPKAGVAVPSPADPLASLPKPAVPACGTSTQSPYNGSSGPITITGGATLSPNLAFCGGIRIKSGANVVFQPGTYVITSVGGPGGLDIDLGATVSGNGVTFYNAGPTGGVTFGRSTSASGGVSLVAPTGGTYAGILFFQDAQDTAQATLTGSSGWSTDLEGTYYFPSAKVLTAFSGTVRYNLLIAKAIEFTQLSGASANPTSVFSSDYSALPAGSPLGSISGATVIQ